MAYTSCASQLGANIAQDCAHPLVGGYTGEMLLIDLSAVTMTPTVSVSNPRILTNIALAAGDKVAVVDNAWGTPFDGSTTEVTTDNGAPKYTKTLGFRVPKRGAGASKDIVEAFYNNPAGFLAIVPKNDKVGDGSFEVIGYQKPLKGSAGSRNENEQDGSVSITLTTQEAWFEVVLFDTDYATTKAIYDSLKALAY